MDVVKSFDDIFLDCTSLGVKLKTEEYAVSGQYAIVDQGQHDIAGYTDRTEGVYADVPAIIFGDHTRVIKYIDQPLFLGADGVKLLKAKEESANYKYLYYALRSIRIPNTGYNRHFKWLKESQIEYPDAETQQKVVDTLDKVIGIITIRKQQLSDFDTLIKARFVELFIGKGYPTKTVDEVSLTKGEYGAKSASVEYDPTRPRYVRITDINDDGTLNNDVVASVNPGDDEQYRLVYGDFMFARMGATVGKTYAFIEGNQIFAGYLIRYRLNQQIINPRYLFWYTKQEEYWNWVKLNQSGAAQPGINAKKYGSLRIPIPPIKEQNVFATFVSQVDKSKYVAPHK